MKKFLIGCFVSIVLTLPLRAATVSIQLQTCGILPATNRNITLTPLQAAGSDTIPVMDKIQGTTDENGNWTPILMSGVYQADVRPAWGQVGVTRFYFYVDPSNTVQDAFTHLLIGTNNTYPPNQYAYSAQASDARYALQGQVQNVITNNEINVTLNGVFNGNGNGLSNVNAVRFGNVPSSVLNSGYFTSWMTNSLLDWWSADGIITNDNSVITNVFGKNGNILYGNAIYSSDGVNGYPGFYFDGSGNNILTNGNVILPVCSNSCTIFVVYRYPRTSFLNSVAGGSNPNVIFSGVLQNGVYGAWLAADYGDATMWPMKFSENYPNAGLSFEDVPNYNWTDDTRVYCVTWSPTSFADFWDGKIFQYSKGAQWGGTSTPWPVGFSGILALGNLPNHVWPYKGYIAEFMIFTNSLPNPDIDQINNYLLRKYNLLRNTIMLLGDSMFYGGDATPGGCPQDFLSTNFPNWSIEDLAVPGATTAQSLSNALAMCGTSTGSKKIAVLWNNINNDGNNLSAITNNQISIATNLQSRGILTLLVVPPSNYIADTNQIAPGGEAIRFAYENFATNCWQQYFAGLVDFARDPFVGYSNACTNVVYYTAQPGLHWTNSAFAETAPCLIANIHAVSDGFYFVNSTTAPPPTVSQPWTAQDARAPGRFFSNSNGFWMIH